METFRFKEPKIQPKSGPVHPLPCKNLHPAPVLLRAQVPVTWSVCAPIPWLLCVGCQELRVALFSGEPHTLAVPTSEVMPSLGEGGKGRANEWPTHTEYKGLTPGLSGNTPGAIAFHSSCGIRLRLDFSRSHIFAHLSCSILLPHRFPESAPQYVPRRRNSALGFASGSSTCYILYFSSWNVTIWNCRFAWLLV